MLDWLEGTLPEVEEVHRRLEALLAAPVDPRGWMRREMAARTVFVMLYGFAVEGRDTWIRPTAVTDMSDHQAGQQSAVERRRWLAQTQGVNRPRQIADRWYSENTREPIRDETLRAFVAVGIVIERPGLSTTSPKPRYALAASFAALLDPELSGDELTARLEAWQRDHLSPEARARIALLRRGSGSSQERVLIRLPNGEIRGLDPGPSARLTQAVVEEFARRFLEEPAVVLISESARKATYRDLDLLGGIQLDLDVATALPDVILMDLRARPPQLVFVECVVSDGPVDERRRSELEALALRSGFQAQNCAYVTAFQDRAAGIFRQTAAALAWGSFAWFATEPEHLLIFRDGSTRQAKSLAVFLRDP